MASPQTLSTPPANAAREMADDTIRSLRDRILGAICALTHGRGRGASLMEVRDRVPDVSQGDFDRCIAQFDREGIIAMDRGMDQTLVRMTAPGGLPMNVQCSLKERVLGAIWAAARGTTAHAVTLGELRSRLAEEVAGPDIERAVVALVIEGAVECARSADTVYLRLRSSALQGYPAMPFADHAGYAPFQASHFQGMAAPHAFRHLTERMAQLLFEVRGCRPGYDLKNWADAERMVHELVGA